ncbi:MAG TPA: DUF5668 domain-containing protein [Bryobacteraceae bacterium]|nr:DUF5668 domain-containing protein [Bryobacteraceae bacterium]
MTTRYRDYAARRHPSGGMTFGLIVIVVGALLLLSNLGIFHIHDIFRFWPVAIIAAGLAAALDARDTGGQIAGGIIVLLGAWLLADRLHLPFFRFHELWPLLLIAFGVLLLWRSVERSAGGGPSPSPGDGSFRGHVAFGGSRRQLNTEQFTGGEVEALFGGYEIDLRKAVMAGDEAVLIAKAMFGGVEIIVPETWSVSVQGQAVFGGYEDKTRQPDPGTPGMKRLIVAGSAVFGGVSIRN